MGAGRGTRIRVAAIAIAGALAALAGPAVAPAMALTGVDLSNYVRVGRFDLPAPVGTPPADGNLLAQEASGVAYNPSTGTLFIVGDGARGIVQVSRTGELIDAMTLPAGEFLDTEGIAHVSGNTFVFTEERVRRAVRFTYAAGTTLTRAATQTVTLGATVENIGLEGITNDPQTSGFIAVKESAPQGIFQTGIDFTALTATNGSPSTVNSANLFDPALLGLLDFADVFALSNVSTLTGAQTGNLLVLSQASGRVVNTNRSGAISSSLTIVADPGSPNTASDQGHEGLTLDGDGNLYIVSEEGGGGANQPQLWVYAPSAVPNQAPTAVALTGQTTTIVENTSTAARIRVANVAVTDDALGTNQLSVTGADAAAFEVDSTGLYIKAGTVLDFEAKAGYAVSVAVDDTTVGTTPDATSAPFTLTVTDVVNENPALAPLVITEVSPWSSGNSPYAADWFEVTNTGADAVGLAGYKVDDSSNVFGSAIALTGATSIAPGESVVFIEGSATAANAFKTAWFGTDVPAGFQIGTYSGGGIGLGTGGDAVNLFNDAGIRVTGVQFASSTSLFTFDNAAGIGAATPPPPFISALSVAGVNGAFVAGGETGSPGRIADTIAPTVTYSGNAGTYAVDAQVAITCSAADDSRGSGLASTTCADVTGPAAGFGLGPEAFSATATDNAGNVGSGSGSFTVIATATSVCTLTTRYVTGSATYAGLKANQQATVDKTVAALCADALAPIDEPGMTPMRKQALVSRYAARLNGFVGERVLTQAQADALAGFAAAL